LLPDEYHRCQKEECLAFGFVVSTWLSRHKDTS
jgi:hypothetical protein